MEEREKKIQKASAVAWILNGSLAAVKIAGGMLGRSSSMLADGIHSLADLAGDSIVLFFLWLSQKTGKSFRKSGYEKTATLIVALVLLVFAGELLSDAVEKVREIIGGASVEAPGMIAIIAGLVSIAVKEFVYRYMTKVADETESAVLKANAWHSHADVLSTIAAIVAIFIARTAGNIWAVLDPLAGCAISIMIIVIAVKTAVPFLKKED